jgi:ribosomal protein S18 acetylase RimI-like enzyme
MKVVRLTSRQVGAAVNVLASIEGARADRPHLRKFLADSRHYFIAVSSRNRWLGYALAYELPHPRRRAGAMFLYSIDVAKKYRRKGVGSLLIKFLKEVAASRGLTEIFVFTNHSNRGAVAFYKRTGGIIENGDDLMFVYPTKKGGR